MGLGVVAAVTSVIIAPSVVVLIITVTVSFPVGANICQAWSLTQFYSVTIKDRWKKVCSLQTSRFPPVVFYDVLGPPTHLPISLFLCRSVATQDARRRALKGHHVSSMKAFKRRRLMVSQSASWPEFFGGKITRKIRVFFIKNPEFFGKSTKNSGHDANWDTIRQGSCWLELFLTTVIDRFSRHRFSRKFRFNRQF